MSILVPLLVTLLIFRYRCEHCQFDSEKRRVMFDHIRSLHVDTSEIWKCDFCQFETMYKCNLVNHIKKMHETNTDRETVLPANKEAHQQQQEKNQPSSSSVADDNKIVDALKPSV